MKKETDPDIGTKIENYFNKKVILDELTNQRYKDLLFPLCDEPYPLNRVGTFLRVTKNFLPHWVNLPKFKKKIRKQGGSLIKKLFERYNSKERFLYNLIDTVSFDLGTASYAPEWSNKKTMAHLTRINSAAPAAVVANNLVNPKLISNIIEYFKQPATKDKYTILDIGPGTGSTIAPLIKKIDELSGKQIPKDYNEKIRVLLLDISDHILKCTSNMLKKGYFLNFSLKNCYHYKPLKEVLCINDNFAKIGANKELLQYKNKVNAIISGGAIMHNTNTDPFFRTMNDLLHNEGVLNIWDWSGGYSWAAPNLKLGNKRGVVYEVSHDNKIKRIEVEEGNTIDEKLIEDADFKATYTILEEDVKPIRENFLIGWLGNRGLLGYHGKKYKLIRKKIKKDFEEGLGGEGFNFINWLKDNVAGKLEEPPEESKTPYYMIEGYGPSSFYIESMQKAGFSYSKDLSLREACKVMGKPQIKHVEGEDLLFFVVGKK